jgi:hypothetical protein
LHDIFEKELSKDDQETIKLRIASDKDIRKRHYIYFKKLLKPNSNSYDKAEIQAMTITTRYDYDPKDKKILFEFRGLNTLLKYLCGKQSNLYLNNILDCKY